MQYRIIYLAVSLLLAFAAYGARAQAPAPQSVLVISADSLSYPYLAELFGSFKSTVQQQVKQPLRLHAESLDLANHDSSAYRGAVAGWYRQKYAGQPPTVIVVIGHAALQFLLQSQLWPGVPVYFVAASASAVSAMTLPPNVTGQTVRASLAGMVQLAKRLLPGTRSMALVGNLPERDNYRPFRAPELAALKAQVEFIDLRGMPYETMLRRVADLPEHTVIYHTTLNDDGSGRIFEPRLALQAMLRVANRPTLVDTSPSVGLGPVGGLVFHPAAQGKAAGLRVARLLAGAAPSALPIELDGFPPVFDWRQLQHWRIAQERLPQASEVRFYQPTVWEQYRTQILLALALIVCLSALSAALLVERRLRAAAVAQSRKRLAEVAHMNRNATASVYSAAIAHELNQPLAAILSNAEAAQLMLGRDAPPLPELREILDDICRDDRRASDLIARMRTLLKPSEANLQVVDINVIVADALKFIASEASMRGAAIVSDLCAEAAPVLVDTVQLQQVLINLVINSLDAMSGMLASAKRISIATRVLPAGQVEVTVTDTGIGFDSHIDEVFNSFFTTKSHGMGLGLSITAAIIQSHGGAIAASNGADGGARIVFQLPLKESP
jgi:signal transduction histidine kinase/ABC-type uncharacterized transport system substrate-binding protein